MIDESEKNIHSSSVTKDPSSFSSSLSDSSIGSAAASWTKLHLSPTPQTSLSSWQARAKSQIKQVIWAHMPTTLAPILHLQNQDLILMSTNLILCWNVSAYYKTWPGPICLAWPQSWPGLNFGLYFGLNPNFGMASKVGLVLNLASKFFWASFFCQTCSSPFAF